MDGVDWLVALQHRLHSRESNHGTAVQVTERSENVETVSEYAGNIRRMIVIVRSLSD